MASVLFVVVVVVQTPEVAVQMYRTEKRGIVIDDRWPIEVGVVCLGAWFAFLHLTAIKNLFIISALLPTVLISNQNTFKVLISRPELEAVSIF